METIRTKEYDALNLCPVELGLLLTRRLAAAGGGSVFVTSLYLSQIFDLHRDDLDQSVYNLCRAFHLLALPEDWVDEEGKLVHGYAFTRLSDDQDE
jgi:hypothetical protein